MTGKTQSAGFGMTKLAGSFFELMDWFGNGSVAS